MRVWSVLVLCVDVYVYSVCVHAECVFVLSGDVYMYMCVGMC